MAMAENQTNGYKSGSNLERVFRAGHFAVTGELGPPQSADPEGLPSPQPTPSPAQVGQTALPMTKSNRQDQHK